MDKTEYEKMHNLHNKYWWFKGKQEIILHLINKYKPETKTILDIGCGDGYFFDKFSGIGIEPCHIFQKDNILNCRIENVNISDKFDTILCLDVLEHLENDTVIHRFLDNNLAENGLAIITVPAHKKLFNHHDEVNKHFRRYDKEDLEKLLEKYNTQIYYYNSLLYPAEYLVRKLSKGNNNFRPLPKLVNSILLNIFKLEKYLYKYFTTGMSLVAIVRKNSNGNA